MRIAVTGPDGFLAWHVRCNLQARTGQDAILISRNELENPDLLIKSLEHCSAVIHLAALNRDAPDEVILTNNVSTTQALADAIVEIGHPVPVIFANSIHADGSSAFGVSKRESSKILSELEAKTGSIFVDVVLPNIFGEHGRANYNSFVATFCSQVFRGDQVTIDSDREISLLHAQEAADLLIDAAINPQSGRIDPKGKPHLISDVLATIQVIAEAYRTGQYPDLSDKFTRDLFNTYRSHGFPEMFPIHPDAMTDPRGRLIEAVRAYGGQTQVFFSTTKPGITRGNHFHLRKVERFLVIQGRARISLRRLFTDEVISFDVTGDKPAIIDMPTMWSHNITNTGDTELVTLFYQNEVFNPLDPDTYPTKVEL